MIKLLIGLSMLGSLSAISSEAKVICASGSSYSKDAKAAVVSLNSEIAKALKDGYKNVSAPTITSQTNSEEALACVTVSN